MHIQWRAASMAAALLLLAVPALQGAASPSRPTGFLFKTLKQRGAEYRYTIYVPPTYDASREWPLIVFLNGAGECGTDGAKAAAVGLGPAVMFNIEKWPFIVLFPQKPEVRQQWEDCDAMVMGMLKQARKDYRVDSARIYLTGLSQGGHGTWAIGARHPDVWAAIAPICGYGQPAEFAAALKRTPVWCFHGEADPVVPVKQSQDIVAAIQAEGGEVKLTTYAGVGHDSWVKAYRDENLGDWFLSHQRQR